MERSAESKLPVKEMDDFKRCDPLVFSSPSD